MFVPIDRNAPLAEQIYQHIRSAILGGTLTPGKRLPPTRELARDLSVSRNTVLSAYERLGAEGYVEGGGSSGTWVCHDLPDPTPVRKRARPSGRSRSSGRSSGPSSGRSSGRTSGPSSPRSRSRSRIPRHQLTPYAQAAMRHRDLFSPLSSTDRSHLEVDFRFNVALADLPARRVWSQLQREVASRLAAAPPPVRMLNREESLRATVARDLAVTRGIRAEPEQVFPVDTGLHAIGLVARALVPSGARVALEDPHFMGARQVFRSLGAKVTTVPVDTDGLRVDRLPRDGDSVRLAYLSPSLQWPTGGVLPLARRLRLLEWARTQDAFVLENDHNTHLPDRGRPLESLQSIDADGRVLYLAMPSHLFSPPVSLAYLVVPPGLVDTFEALIALEGRRHQLLVTEVMEAFLSGGHMARLLRRINTRVRPVRRYLRERLSRIEGLSVGPGNGGLHVHAQVRGWSPRQIDEVVRRAEARGVGLYPDAPYYFRRPANGGLIFGFGELDAKQIDRGLKVLADELSN